MEKEGIRGKKGPGACFRVPEDGSCFFHSVAILTNFCNIRSCSDDNRRVRIGLELRKQILKASQWDRFNKATGFTGLSPPLEQARAPRDYADDFIINFSARRLGLNLLVYDDTSSDVYLFPCSPKAHKKKRPYICLRWIKRCHFEPIAEICAEGGLELPRKDGFVHDRFPNANSRFLMGIVQPENSLLAKKLLGMSTKRVDKIEV